jgi:4-aminobutyrate aminotransferase-like enzyme
VLEPVQGEGGFIPMPPDFVPRLKQLCERHGILYVDDEVQAGCGRTGTVWAIERYGVEPDLLVSGKSLGGGLPLAGVTGMAELMDAVPPGGLGGTFGGNPLACAAASVVLDEIATDGFRTRADQLARHLRTRLDEIAAQYDAVGEVRGLGAMLALELTEPTPDLARAVVDAAYARGLLLLACGIYGNVIRLLPPLSATDEELERGLDLLGGSLGDAGAAAAR